MYYSTMYRYICDSLTGTFKNDAIILLKSFLNSYCIKLKQL